MTDSNANRVYFFWSRFCLWMAGLSLLFWFTSWPSIPYVTEFDAYYELMEDFPNCVSARSDNLIFGVGHLSHNRMSSLFLTREWLEPGKAVWSERSDGHFCGFEIPPYNFGYQPTGFAIRMSSQTFGWDCPYWLMALLWTAMYWKTRMSSRFRFRFRLLDLFIATTVIAVAIALIRMKSALIVTAFLNTATLLLLFCIVISSIAVLFCSRNAWWPFIIPEGAENDGAHDRA